ncbi:hypothetical protein GGG16DRAFT_66665, partial [Schizophyllum commune]
MPPSARVYTPRAFVAPRSFRPETPPPSAGKPPRILKSQPVSAPKVTVNTRVASSPVRSATSAKISRTVRTTIKPVHSHGSRSRSSSSSLSPRRSKTPIKRGVYEMPPLGTRHAPKKFTGKAEDVADFISHYERLLRQYQVTNGRDRCRSILQYCSTQVKQYIKGLREFADFDWRALKKNLLFFYDAEKGEHTYNACDMVDFAQRSCEKLITNLGLWKKYFRRYVRRSGALVNSGKITTDDEAYYFWMGIHPDLRAVLESKIQLRRQMRRESESSEESDSEDDEEVYSVREICSAAHHQFRRNRFVTRRFDADRFGQRPGEESSGSETDSDANDTSDDSGAEKLKKKLRLEKKRKEHRKEKKKEKRQLERTSKMTGSPADLTQIVQKLNSMKPDSELYAPMYLKAVMLDTTGPTYAPLLPTYRPLPPPPVRPMPYSSAPRALPPHMADGFARRPTPATGANAAPQGCFGCGDPAHRVSDCPRINKLIREQKVRKDPINKRLTLMDGSFIRRGPDESLASAAERATGSTAAQVNYFRTSVEEGSEDAFSAPGITYPAKERLEKAGTPARRPGLRDRGPRQTVPSKFREFAKSKPDRKTVPTNLSQPPTEAQQAPDTIMDPPPAEPESAPKDRHEDRQARVPEAPREEHTPHHDAPMPRHVPMPDAPPSRRLPPKVLVDAILDQPITTTARQICAVSKEVRSEFQEKFKPIAASQPGVYALGPGDDDLITLKVRCGGKVINAIVDTGSQLNVMRGALARELLSHKPVDISGAISMNDANGGIGRLKGLIEDVELTLDGSNLRTVCDVHIGGHVKFDLLLGRPWQRQNMISIDERDDGTYLEF